MYCLLWFSCNMLQDCGLVITVGEDRCVEVLMNCFVPAIAGGEITQRPQRTINRCSSESRKVSCARIASFNPFMKSHFKQVPQPQLLHLIHQRRWQLSLPGSKQTRDFIENRPHFYIFASSIIAQAIHVSQFL